MDSGGEWCTYVQAAQRLHKSHGAIRQMALRGQLQRIRGNDGKARVLVLPDMERAAHVQAEQKDERPEQALSVQPERAELVHALESHIKTLQAENEALRQAGAAAEARATQEAEKTTRAIEAFADLARRLDQLAEANQRARPWWKRLAG